MVAHPIVYAGAAGVAAAGAVGGVVVAALGTDWVGIITAVGVIVVGLTGAIAAPLFIYLNRKLDAAKAAADEAKTLAAAIEERRIAAEAATKTTLTEMGKQLDGKADKAIAAAERAASAEGQLKGAADEQARVALTPEGPASPAAPLSTKDVKQLIQDAGIIKAVDDGAAATVAAVKEGPKT